MDQEPFSAYSDFGNHCGILFCEKQEKTKNSYCDLSGAPCSCSTSSIYIGMNPTNVLYAVATILGPAALFGKAAVPVY